MTVTNQATYADAYRTFNVTMQQFIDDAAFGKLCDEYARQELDLPPDQDVDENNAYWNLISLFTYHFMTRWLSEMYAPSLVR